MSSHSFKIMNSFGEAEKFILHPNMYISGTFLIWGKNSEENMLSVFMTLITYTKISKIWQNNELISVTTEADRDW